MVRAYLNSALTLLITLAGCTGPVPRPSSVTLLNRADPVAADLLAYLQSQHVPLDHLGDGQTRIQPTPQGRQALIQFLEFTHLQMQMCAANIANCNTTRDANASPAPYRRRFVTITSTGQAQTRMDDAPFTRRYAPGHPDADPAGFVAYPNVDCEVERIICQQASQAYDLTRTILRRMDPSIIVTSPPAPS